MSYDLNFWRQKPDEARSPLAIYQALCAGESVEGLVELPITEMVAAILEAFPGSTSGPNGESGLFIEDIDGGGALMAGWSPVHLRVDCYGATGEAMNRVIDVGLRFECPLYDPQVNERFR